ncbi:MAG: RNA-binding S4 domain-containing protein [Candidatus Didemnitutus sp.]|nr:RNA-binding S4 domain-containing protein [Candidatus Didemnitutus sp.]
MKKTPSVAPATRAVAREILVREVPIDLCQFIKFGGVVGTGGEAKQIIASGMVTLNGTVETQKRKKLVAGDLVSANGETLVVRVQ